MKKTLLIAIMLPLLASCAKTDDDDALPMAGPPAIDDNVRVRVQLLNVYRDKLAYGNSRGVYLIKDTKTGVEYIGISGIGIQEVGSHSVGKTQQEDER